jgi:hypothetical protein
VSRSNDRDTGQVERGLEGTHIACDVM